MLALSSNHYSVDDQIKDVVDWLRDPENAALADCDWDEFVKEFPEFDKLVWSGAWVDTEDSGVNPEYMSWVADWIEAHTLVVWNDGEPYADVHEGDESDEDLSEMGRLLDEIDKAAEGDSNDAEIDALRTALDYAVGLLIEEGYTIPRQ